jgi:hypothetical protein
MVLHPDHKVSTRVRAVYIPVSAVLNYAVEAGLPGAVEQREQTPDP